MDCYDVKHSMVYLIIVSFSFEEPSEEELRDFEYHCAMKVFKGETKGASADNQEESLTQQVLISIYL